LDRARLFAACALSCSIWYLLYAVVTPFLSKMIVPIHYDKMLQDSKKKDEKIAKKARNALGEWNSRWPGFLHAVIQGCLGIYCCFFDKELIENTVSNTSTAWMVACAVACGFFAWDLLICLTNYEVFGWQFVLHAMFCLFTYITCGFVQKYPFAWHGASFLIFELSTPVLHIRSALIEFKCDSSAITISTYVFAVVFFLVRIVWGNFYAFPLVWNHLIRLDDMPSWQKIAFWAFSLLSAGLNSFWMLQIVKSGMKKRNGKSKSGKTVQRA